MEDVVFVCVCPPQTEQTMKTKEHGWKLAARIGTEPFRGPMRRVLHDHICVCVQWYDIICTMHV